MPCPTLTLRRCVAPALAIAIACVGCAPESERAYYQTRYIPAGGSDDTFSAHERAGWSGDREVYELPAQPPAYVDHDARRDCHVPGPAFKSDPVGGQRGGRIAATGYGEVQPIGGFDPRPVPVDALPPAPGLPIGGQRAEEHGPALVQRVDQARGDYDPRPRSVTGAGVSVIAGGAPARMRSADSWDFCLDPEIPTPAGGTQAATRNAQSPVTSRAAGDAAR